MSRTDFYKVSDTLYANGRGCDGIGTHRMLWFGVSRGFDTAGIGLRMVPFSK